MKNSIEPETVDTVHTHTHTQVVLPKMKNKIFA